MTKVRAPGNSASSNVSVSGVNVEENGSLVGRSKTLNFVGNVSVQKVGDKIVITITGGGSGTITNGSGTTANGSAVDWTGVLNKDAVIDLASFALGISNASGLVFALTGGNTMLLGYQSFTIGAGPSGISMGAFNVVTAGSRITLGSDAAGDMYHFNGTILTRIPAGALNTILQMGPSSVPGWVSGSSLLGFNPSRRLLYKNNVSSSLTGTTTETIMDSVVIAAGTLAANDKLSLVYTCSKSGATGTWAPRLRVIAGGTATIAGSTVLSIQSLAASVLSASQERELTFKNSLTSQEIFPAAVTSVTHINTSTSALTVLTNDYSAQQTIFITLDPDAAGDTLTLNSWYLEIIRT